MSQTPELPQPEPALRRLDRLVGRWSMEGNLVGSDEKNIKGETVFRWLPGGFFLEQRVQIDFLGQQIDALELIGYDPESDTFPSTVFSGFSSMPLPYKSGATTLRSLCRTARWTQRSPAPGAKTAPSRAAGDRIQAPTRPRTSPTT